MNVSDVTTEGIVNARPGREALPGGTHVVEGPDEKRRKGRRRNDESMVPDAQFSSYYGRPVIKAPVWEAREIAGYFFLGGLAGASSLLGAGASLTGKTSLAKSAKVGAAAAIGLSLVALVKDLGRPSRFVNMLRVFKPTSPMSVGSWIVSAYAPTAIAAALCEVTGLFAPIGVLATGTAAVLGSGVAAYTGVLIADTAVPVWHDAYRELPFLFVSSAATAAAGLGLVTAATKDLAPARHLALVGVGGELATGVVMDRRLGEIGDVYHKDRSGTVMTASRSLAVLGALGSTFGARWRPVRIASGLCLLAASACTRFGVFYGGVASANDPGATIKPQRARRAAREAAATPG